MIYMKHNKLLYLLNLLGLVVLLATTPITSIAQAVITTGDGSPDGSAMLEVKSTERGFLPPRLTTVQRDAISNPAEGLWIYNTDMKCLEWWNGNRWFNVCCPVPDQTSVITGAETPCIGASEAYSVTDEGVDYAWTVPSGWIITAGGGTSEITVTVGTNAGNIAVTPSNACGNGPQQTIAVIPAAITGVNISGTNSIAVGASTVFTAVTVPAISSGLGYQWYVSYVGGSMTSLSDGEQVTGYYVHGSNTSTLQLNYITDIEQGAVFTCKISNECTPDGKYGTRTLTVNGKSWFIITSTATGVVDRQNGLANTKALLQWTTAGYNLDIASNGMPSDINATNLAGIKTPAGAVEVCFRRNYDEGGFLKPGTTADNMWYLPAETELMRMNIDKTCSPYAFDNYSNGYWSSTERDASYSWHLSFAYNGYTFRNGKNNAFRVRCVRH
jgi:hypothetical protein